MCMNVVLMHYVGETGLPLSRGKGGGGGVSGLVGRSQVGVGWSEEQADQEKQGGGKLEKGNQGLNQRTSEIPAAGLQAETLLLNRLR